MCVAQNPAGTALGKTKLKVQGTFHEVIFCSVVCKYMYCPYGLSCKNPCLISWSVSFPSSVPPLISSQIKSYVVALDASITLLCQAEGHPSPEVTWHKDGQLVTESVRQRVLNSGSLQIAFAQPSDTGRYTCTAINVAGSNSLELSLTVHRESLPRESLFVLDIRFSP